MRSNPTGTDSPTEPVRCRGDAVSVERSVTDRPGYDDNIEYFPSNRTVRFVSVKRGDDPVKFGTWSFEEWATFESAEAGLERTREATARRLGTADFGSSIGAPPGFAATGDVVIWVSVSSRREGGTVVETPEAPVGRLADAAPRSVDATVSLDGETFSRAVPVFAKQTVTELH